MKYSVERITSHEPVMATNPEGKQVDTGYTRVGSTEKIKEIELDPRWTDPAVVLDAVGVVAGTVNEMDNGNVSISTPKEAYVLKPVDPEGDMPKRGWTKVKGAF